VPTRKPKKIWRPRDVIGQYIRCPHCGQLLKAIRVSHVYHEGTDPAGNENRWFEVTLSDGEGIRFWERTW
jgi:hypothetical protein